MTNAKSTKKALMLSILSLVLCFSMLIGTTFAWFTDSVTSANNIITSGNLDITLEYLNDAGKWTDVEGSSEIFDKDALWEPGYTKTVYLRVKNAGSLALKYQLGVNIASETAGMNVAGDFFLLSDYIYYDVKLMNSNDFAPFADREAAMKIATETKKISAGYTNAGSLEAGSDYVYVAMVVYMPTTVGNEANYKTGTNAPQINLGVNVFATQYTFEEDSFGNDYDEEAPWTGIVDTTWYNTTDTSFELTKPEQLAGLAALVNSGNTFEGKTITLKGNMDLNNVNWTPIGGASGKFQGSFYGTGYTISNLRSVGAENVGLFGRTFTGAHIEGVTVVNAYVSGNDYVGVIVGGGYVSRNCIKNCVVEGATVIATPYQKADGTYDGGAKAGVIAGMIYNGHVIGNTAKNSTVIAYRDLGGVVGMLAVDGSFTIEASGNTASNVTLNYVGVAGAYDGNTPNQNMAEIVGRVGKNAVVAENNTATGVTQNEANKGATAIYTYNELVAFANAVNGGNTYAGKTVILGADIDLMNAEWTPIGTGSGFNGVFDGNGKTISNLKITGNNSTVGLFANTYNGEIRNLTVENATVSGRLNVGVVAGNPYTSKYTNITVKGHVEVNGMAYVGGVGGKNAYADWTNITVDVDETSYVNANSVENGNAYRTYVGGVVGFNGEGGHTFKNITSNINVLGSTCDVGGAFGIAHYGNQFENVTVTGNVTVYNATEADEAEEMGGIAGVWHNGGADVTFTNCQFKGALFANFAVGVDLSDNALTGKSYSATGTGKLVVNGVEVVLTVADLQAKINAATAGTTIIVFGANLTGNITINQNVNAHLIIDGNAYKYDGTITIKAQSKTEAPGSITFKDINFKTSVDERTFISSSETNHYPLNVTVTGCTFEGSGANSNVVGISVKSAKNLVIENCTATKMHSILQNTSGWNLTISNVTVTESGRGVALGTVQGVTITGLTVEAAKYGIRMDAGYNNNAVITDCNVTAFIPVVVRKVTVNSSVTFNGTNTMTGTNTDGLWCAIGTSEYETNGTMPTAAVKTVTVTLNDTGLNVNGLYNNSGK